MLFYLLGLIYFLIMLIAFLENYNARELEKDERKWKARNAVKLRENDELT